MYQTQSACYSPFVRHILTRPGFTLLAPVDNLQLTLAFRIISWLSVRCILFRFIRSHNVSQDHFMLHKVLIIQFICWKSWNFPWIKIWSALNNSTQLGVQGRLSNEWIPCCTVNGPQLVAMLVTMLAAWRWSSRGRPGSASACPNAFIYFHMNEGDIIKTEAPAL